MRSALSRRHSGSARSLGGAYSTAAPISRCLPASRPAEVPGLLQERNALFCPGPSTVPAFDLIRSCVHTWRRTFNASKPRVRRLEPRGLSQEVWMHRSGGYFSFKRLGIASLAAAGLAAFSGGAAEAQKKIIRSVP